MTSSCLRQGDLFFAYLFWDWRTAYLFWG